MSNVDLDGENVEYKDKDHFYVRGVPHIVRRRIKEYAARHGLYMGDALAELVEAGYDLLAKMDGQK